MAALKAQNLRLQGRVTKLRLTLKAIHNQIGDALRNDQDAAAQMGDTYAEN